MLVKVNRHSLIRLLLVPFACSGILSCTSLSGHITAAEVTTDSATYAILRQVYPASQYLSLTVLAKIRNTGETPIVVRRRCDTDTVPSHRFVRIDGGPLSTAFMEVCALAITKPPMLIAPGDSIMSAVVVTQMVPSATDSAPMKSIIGEYRLEMMIQSQNDMSEPPVSLIPLEFRVTAPFRIVLPE